MNNIELFNQVIKLQKIYINKIKETKEPYTINLLGKSILVNPGVFPPYIDTQLIIKNMKIDKSDRILELCAGTGAISIFAAEKGKKVVATDINSKAVENIIENAKKHGFQEKLEAYRSNILPPLKEKFDVILINPPYTDHNVTDIIERVVWDYQHESVITFFKGIHEYMESNSRIYLGWANFADLNFIFDIANKNELKAELIDEAWEGDSQFVTFRIKFRNK